MSGVHLALVLAISDPGQGLLACWPPRPMCRQLLEWFRGLPDTAGWLVRASVKPAILSSGMLLAGQLLVPQAPQGLPWRAVPCACPRFWACPAPPCGAPRPGRVADSFVGIWDLTGGISPGPGLARPPGVSSAAAEPGQPEHMLAPRLDPVRASARGCRMGTASWPGAGHTQVHQ